ncbi:peptidoglycan-binding domain-containing protein [Pararoseomonas indoligenes]|uniref:Peptidoglycan-binding protein n=1 Tax=Roseomonas indoligenes TaxID=2820811 RepID=A0A940N2I2_9PROT|nr:peptidoglycan-binding domain-containing protein [Pararoseomonas indoligenes]MBP0496028.1 peptidoglycan-binding protein [Pararoseomonas indoligenes]
MRIQVLTGSNPAGQLGLKRRDVAFVQAYQALRHQLQKEQQAALRQDAQAFHAYVVRECGLPQAGPVPSATRASAVACVDRAYTGKRADYARWLGREANEETSRDVGEHVELQRLLSGATGGAPPIPLNGVYGQATRDSLRAFQARAGLAQSGFLDNATADALRRSGGAAQSAFVPATQGVPPRRAMPPQADAGASVMASAPAAPQSGNSPRTGSPAAGSPASPIAALPCPAVSLRVVRQTRWGPGTMLFGMPQERWTKDDYAALIARIDACLVENRDDPRNFIAMRQYIETLVSSAPDPRGDEARRVARAREESEKAERAELVRKEAERRRAEDDRRFTARAAEAQRQAEAQRAALRQATLEAAAREPVFDCADRDVLRQVQRLMEEQSNPLVTIRVLRLYEPGLTSEHGAIDERTPTMMVRFRAPGVATPEDRNLLRVQMGLPRCTARVLTNQGDSVVGYEKIERGGQLFLRIRLEFLW